MLGARDEEGPRLGEPPAQDGRHREGRQGDDVEEAPVERCQRNEQQQAGHRAVADARDDAERAEPGAAPVLAHLLGHHQAGEPRFGGQEDPGHGLQHHERDQAPGERGEPGHQAEDGERRDQHRAAPPAVRQAQQGQRAQRGQADDGDADAERGDRHPQAAGDLRRGEGEQRDVVDLEEAGDRERREDPPLAPAEVNNRPDVAPPPRRLSDRPRCGLRGDPQRRRSVPTG